MSCVLLLQQTRFLSDRFHPSIDIIAFHELFDELINFEPGHIGHDHDVGNVFFTGELPSFDEFVIHGTFEDDSG